MKTNGSEAAVGSVQLSPKRLDLRSEGRLRSREGIRETWGQWSRISLLLANRQKILFALLLMESPFLVLFSSHSIPRVKPIYITVYSKRSYIELLSA